MNDREIDRDDLESRLIAQSRLLQEIAEALGMLPGQHMNKQTILAAIAHSVAERDRWAAENTRLWRRIEGIQAICAGKGDLR